MATPELLDTTGDHRCDKVVQGVIGIFELVFPGRLRACYLRGSRASGASIDGSDLDLYLVFKDRFVDGVEGKRAQQLVDHCSRLTPMLLEIVLIGELRLRDTDALYAAVDLKLGTRLLYGEDIRPRLPACDAGAYVREIVHTPYYSYSLPKQRQDRLVYPLRHLDPKGEFYGFDQLLIPGPDGADVPSTKLLVATVGWTATAIIAMRAGAGVYVRDKAACVQLYREHVAGEWADLVTQVHDLCRNTWHYLLPTDDAGRRSLRAFCGRALDFQNHYLQLYLDYQLGELACGDPERQLLAVGRLDQFVFPGERVASALRALQDTGHDRLRESLASTLATYRAPA